MLSIKGSAGVKDASEGGFAERATFALKMALTILSLLCLPAWLVIFFHVVAWTSWGGFSPTRVAVYWLPALYPFAYLCFCLYSCFGHMRGRTLVILGAVFNLPLLLVGVYGLGRGSVLIGVVCLTFALLWALLCLARISAGDGDA